MRAALPVLLLLVTPAAAEGIILLRPQVVVEEPVLRHVDGGHEVACHFPLVATRS